MVYLTLRSEPRFYVLASSASCLQLHTSDFCFQFINKQCKDLSLGCCERTGKKSKSLIIFYFILKGLHISPIV